MRGTDATPSLGRADAGPEGAPHPPAATRADKLQYASVIRLVGAEAERSQLSYVTDPAKMDEILLVAGRMTHEERLARLNYLGELSADLILPEPAR